VWNLFRRKIDIFLKAVFKNMNNELVKVNDRTFKKYITAEKIAQAIKGIAGKINRDFEGEPIMLLVVLKGSMIFAADLMREITIPCQLETVRACSYGNAMETSGKVELDFTAIDFKGKNVIVVEDIVDSGLTLQALVEWLLKESPKSVNIAALLSKPEARRADIDVKYVGIEIPPAFVVGYGLDYAELGRNLPEIYVLAEG
jgi:hypoxanthine phosphoribosyltransferase